MTTARDDFVIDFDSYNLLNRIRAFKHSDLDDKGLHQAFGIRVKKGWSIRKAWQELQSIHDGQIQEYIQPVLYRPFDVRYIFYHDAVVWRTVKRVMSHMLAGENLALLTKRQGKRQPYSYALVTNMICESCVFESAYANNTVIPLYLYPSAKEPEMLYRERRPNLAEWLLPSLSAAYGFTPTPEEVLAYIYAVLYSPTYRQEYAQELRTDFPRIPFTADAGLFRQMAELGQRLIALHLLNSPELDPPVARYPVPGPNNIIERVKYDEAQQRVYINDDKYFEGITPQMWAYHIGGYQVLAKYLKDRKDRRLDNPVYYIRIATAIACTIDIQKLTNCIYPSVESSSLPDLRRVTSTNMPPKLK